ncbi:MAG: hypothetical protein LBQ06_08145 [Frankiaceae bacterium]|nr:hypothetical protein [Frankiaceae bacterium]
MSGDGADVRFYFDPVCPFAWLTSKWVRMVAARRGYAVDWRFISLRMLNAEVDYAAHFPPRYEQGHTAGLRLLRVAARARAEHGPAAVGPLYERMGAHNFDQAPDRSRYLPDRDYRGTPGYVEPILAEAGLPTALSAALDDQSLDAPIRAETDEALRLAGKDVGTPILQFSPPEGMAFFGPVISRLPAPEDAERLWDHVAGLASFPGFAELKRSLREPPQLRSLARDS